VEAAMMHEIPLSKNEFEVLRLVNAGLSNQEIAETLRMSLGTTKWHMHQVLRKLAVRNRTAAAAKARSLGLL
jgi:LuxR family transcriptional regulator, maltose regulon positive regulatory protein